MESKHPDPEPIAKKTLKQYDDPPPFMDLQITDENVLDTARKLHGSCGLGGTDAATLSNWLTHYKDASIQLRASLASISEWMTNSFVPWAAIRALMSNRLVALDKCPGVRPIGIGQIWRRAITKCFLSVASPAATEACGTQQLCCGLSAGIEGAIHAAQQDWQEHSQEPDYGFLCIDGTNAFNTLDRTNMLWSVCHEWPQGAHFTFN